MKKIIVVSIALLLSGCATQVDKFSYLKQWNDSWQACDRQGKTSTLTFPASPWFNALAREDKIAVLIYLNELKDYQCTEDEALRLKAVLADADITTLNDLLKGFIYFETPDKEAIQHLDQSQVEALAKAIDGPFNPLKVAEDLGMLQP
ncbi:hypothetical protein I6M59_08560 [Shewanella algae]|uniref:hypothetical protein n=1 Tax=Shewanella algae TaxID=38313 RepID=UPI001AADF647|nr:hypothetical protein [Shewanella algae]MBO2691801.1 hypothetical protein [Shewanella algae]QTE92396.1 hypothetical protein JKK33_08595 [Shewanella algae]